MFGNGSPVDAGGDSNTKEKEHHNASRPPPLRPQVSFVFELKAIACHTTTTTISLSYLFALNIDIDALCPSLSSDPWLASVPLRKLRRNLGSAVIAADFLANDM